MGSIISWFTTNYSSILTVYSSIIIAARIIVKMLPTPTAGTTLETIVTFLSHVGLVVQSDVKS